MMAARPYARQEDVDRLWSVVLSRIDAGQRQTSTAPWITASVGVLASIVTALSVIGAAIITSSRADAVVCSETYERVRQLHDHGIAPIFPDGSAEQEQCDVNGYIESLESTAPQT